MEPAGQGGRQQRNRGRYRYDGLGRRIRKFTPPTGPTGPSRDFYYNAGWQLLEARQAAGVQRTGSPLAEPAVTTTLQEQYVWSARYIDAPVLRDRRIAGTGRPGQERFRPGRTAVLPHRRPGINVTAVVNGMPGSGTLGASSNDTSTTPTESSRS